METSKTNAVASAATTAPAKTPVRVSVPILNVIESTGADSVPALIEGMTGDKDFTRKFLACVKSQVKAAFHKNEAGKYVNDFALVRTEDILDVLYECATRRILPDGYNGYLVVYKGKAPRVQFLPDWKGLVAAAVQEGAIRSIGAEVVRANDFITIEFGEVTNFTIDPKHDRGEIIGCAAWAIMPDGTRRSTYLPLTELEKVRRCAQSDNIWRGWTEEMYKKTAIRRLLKYIPLSSGRTTAMMAMDDANYDLDRAEDEPERAAPRRRTAKIKPLGGVSVSPSPLDNTEPDAKPFADEDEPTDAVQADTKPVADDSANDSSEPIFD